jgi:gluconolactonase
LFSRLGEPLAHINSCVGLATTNLAYGGKDNKMLYITESESGLVFIAQLDVSGRTIFSHMATTPVAARS